MILLKFESLSVDFKSEIVKCDDVKVGDLLSTGLIFDNGKFRGNLGIWLDSKFSLKDTIKYLNEFAKYGISVTFENPGNFSSHSYCNKDGRWMFDCDCSDPQSKFKEIESIDLGVTDESCRIRKDRTEIQEFTY